MGQQEVAAMKFSGRLLQCLVLMLLGWPAFLAGQAKFGISPGTQFDFGEVYTGLTVKQLFIITNSGTDTLIITDIGASCGCTGTLLSNNHIAPRDSGTLAISFNSKQFTGKVEKTVSMLTNDTAHRRVEIKFTANVLKIIDVSPEYFFVKGLKDSTTTQSVTLKNVSAEPITFLSVKTTLTALSVKLGSTSIKPGESTQLTITITPGATGTISGNIEISTDHPKVPQLNVRFFGYVRDKALQTQKK
jgi:hypothetical protein